MGVENKVALYIRISLEDDDIQEGKEESDSVTNQRALLRRFVSGREDLAGFGVAEFLDDGYTGRNLDRPGFQELIGQCRAGKVGCIVVKDLSRLGRNYVEVALVNKNWTFKLYFFTYNLPLLYSRICFPVLPGCKISQRICRPFFVKKFYICGHFFLNIFSLQVKISK